MGSMWPNEGHKLLRNLGLSWARDYWFLSIVYVARVSDWVLSPWICWGLNLGPSACKAAVLPLNYDPSPKEKGFSISMMLTGKKANQ